MEFIIGKQRMIVRSFDKLGCQDIYVAPCPGFHLLLTILYISPLLFVQHQMSLQTPLTHESPKRVVSSFFQHSLNCSPTHNQRIDLSFGMTKRSCDFTQTYLQLRNCSSERVTSVASDWERNGRFSSPEFRTNRAIYTRQVWASICL